MCSFSSCKKILFSCCFFCRSRFSREGDKPEENGKGLEKNHLLLPSPPCQVQSVLKEWGGPMPWSVALTTSHIPHDAMPSPTSRIAPYSISAGIAELDVDTTASQRICSPAAYKCGLAACSSPFILFGPADPQPEQLQGTV